MSHSGKCQCDNVSITVHTKPMLVAQCNCSRCRRLTGIVAVSAMFSGEEVDINGELSVFEFVGGSGMNVRSHFCPNCACRIYGEADAFPGMVSVPLGVFDDPHQFKPAGEIFTNYKLDWLEDNCIKERFEEAAVGERLEHLLSSLDED